jgi:hypothetical protein
MPFKNQTCFGKLSSSSPNQKVREANKPQLSVLVGVDILELASWQDPT